MSKTIDQSTLMMMQLHETTTLGELQITRVLGGWIYWYGRTGTSGGGITGVFVSEYLGTINKSLGTIAHKI